MKRQSVSRQKLNTHSLDENSSSSAIPTTDELLTSSEVAAMIRKSEAWLARKRWDGTGIPYRKIGRHVRYQLSVVRQWLNEQPEKRSTSDTD